MSKLIKTISQDESKKLLEGLLNKKGTRRQRQNGIRNYLMGLLMLDAGLRVGEIVKLSQSDLVFAGRPVVSLLVSREIAKKQRERTIPMSDRLLAAIEVLEKEVWQKVSVKHGSFAFFRFDCLLPLGSRQVRNIIEDVSVRSLGFRIHPHILRHTFATRLMKTSNIRVVMQLLGHQNLSSTQVYTHPDSQDLKKAIGTLEV